MTETELKALLNVQDFALPLPALLPDAQTYPPYEAGIIYTRWPYLNLSFLGFSTIIDPVESGSDQWFQWGKR